MYGEIPAHVHGKMQDDRLFVVVIVVVMVVVVALVIRTVVITDDVDVVVISVVVVVVVGSRAILIGIAIATTIPAPSSPIKIPFNSSQNVM